MPLPLVTYSLALACLIIFAVGLATGSGGWTRMAGSLQIPLGSNYGPYTTGGDWWRVGTSAVVHFGAFHLITNLVVFLLFAPVGERVWGAPRHLLLVIAGALAGGLASTWIHPNANSAGLSAVVFGVLGALLSAGAFSADRHFRAALKPLRLPTLISTIVLFAAGLADRHTDSAAHLGGLFIGFVMGAAFTRAKAPTLALLLILLVLVPIGGHWLLSDASHRLSPESRFWQVARDVAREEPVAVSNWVAIVDAARTGAAADLQLAKQLERTVLPFWSQAHARLAELTVDADSAPRRQYEYLVELTSRREAAVLTCIEGLRAHDAAIVARCNSEMAEIDRFIIQSSK